MTNNTRDSPRESTTGSDQASDQPLRFRCRETHANLVTPPTAAAETVQHLRENGRLSAEISSNSRYDVKLQDALTTGWFLYPIEATTIQVTTDDSVATAETATEWVTTNSGTPQVSSVATAVVDTGWYVSPPEDVLALVTAPLYNSDPLVVPHTIDHGDGFTRLRLPVKLTDTTVLTPSEPIAQVIPLQADHLPETDGEATVITDDFQNRLEQGSAFGDITANPYRRFYRSKKETGELLPIEESSLGGTD